MKFALSAFLMCLCLGLLAQPANDDCSGAIALGSAPVCDGTIHTTANATPSNIGDNNQPDCFSAVNAINDVWYSFTTTEELTDLTLTIESVAGGPADAPLINPQVAIYRGTCDANGLNQLFCEAITDQQTAVRVEMTGLAAGVEHFIRISDGVATGDLSFFGDFTICIQPDEPTLNMGTLSSTTACQGRLFDSGGPAGNYKNGENQLFTICPAEAHECIQIDINEFTIDEFDFLNIYAGEGTGGPLLARASGASLGSDFRVEAATECVTIEFISDASTTFSGFELTWSCLPEACQGSSFDNPTEIGGLPFSQSGLTTCGEASTFVNSPCANTGFAAGPEHVFSFLSSGGFCAEVSVTNAAPGTGILVLDGDPSNPATNCVAFSLDGALNSADFRTPGNYFIVVANARGCTDFSLEITETDCAPSPALADALCNPINNCIEDVNQSFNLQIENGFKDIEINTGVNGGCWLNDGSEPDYFWFSVEAAAAGDLAFSMESAGLPSDIDFNIWGPFTIDQSCNNPDEIINFIGNNQPIRSSWNTVTGSTGLARIHPESGITVVDVYDCGGTPSGEGDGFVRPIRMETGEVYIVLLNDWDDQIGAAGITVDWSLSDPGVLNSIPTGVLSGNTAICEGESAQIELENFSNTIRWIGNNQTLSCTDCPNPVATPAETTIYTAIVEKACKTDTVEVEIAIFGVDAGPDREVCAGEDFRIFAGREFDNAAYLWTVSPPASEDLVSLSCTDCPDPQITTSAPTATTTITIEVTLTADNCTLTDNMQLTIRPEAAPDFGVSEDAEICIGTDVDLGALGNANNNDYNWSSVPAGFTSSENNPVVTPTETTTYFVTVGNQACGLPSMDSVTITVVEEPVVSVIEDALICQGDAIILGTTTLQSNVEYQWSGPDEIFNPTNPNTAVQPEQTATYRLTASNGPCVVTETVEISVTPSQAEIVEGDTVRVCQGSETGLSVSVQPPGAQAIWTSSDDSVDGIAGNNLTVSPQTATTYYATIENENCISLDSVLVVVDSLPADLSIMPADTTICEGSLLIFESPVFEPKDYPEIAFQWLNEPGTNFQTPDSLYNMVANPDTTLMIFRATTNGACVDTAVTNVMVDTIPDVLIVPTDTTVCTNARVDISVTVEADLEMPMWNPPTLSCTDCLNPTAIAVANQTYNFSAMAGECPVSASTTINVTQLFSFPDPAAICNGDEITLNEFVLPTATYTWTSTDPDFGTSTEPAPVVSPTQTTTYSLLVESDICEPVETEITIEVLDIPQFQFPDELTICEGESITLNTIATPGATYRWTAPDVQQSTDPMLTVSPTQTTTYSLIITNGVCPPIEEQITVEVLPEPVLPVLQELSICQGESILLNNSFEPGLTYSWTSDDDPDFNTTNDPTPSVSPESTSTYRLSVSSECNTIEGTVTVNVTPNAADININASPGTTITMGEEVMISATSSAASPADTYTWTTSEGSFVSVSQDFTDAPGDTTTYILEYAAGGDCFVVIDSITILVKPLPDFETPNAFTPNGDRDNDFFLIETVGDVRIVDFKVYNRWGQVVYDNESNDLGWDGNYNGNPAPSDVYIYVIELEGVPEEDRIQKGDVTLIR